MSAANGTEHCDQCRQHSNRRAGVGQQCDCRVTAREALAHDSRANHGRSK